MFIDNVGFIIKMANSVLACCVGFSYLYLDTNQLVTFPGVLIFYYYYLWIFPVTTITERMRRFWVDRGLHTYARRVLRPNNSVSPMAFYDNGIA